MAHYSHSQVKLYGDCPRSWKLKKKDKITGIIGDPLLFGSGCHSVVGLYINHLAEKGLATDITAMPDIARDALKQAALDKRQPVPIRLHPEITEVCSRWADGYVLEDPDTVVDVEQLDKVKIGDHDWWFVMDLLKIKGQVAKITDWKSSFQVPSGDVSKDPQLRAYAYVVKAKYPQVEQVDVELYYIRNHATQRATLYLDDIIKAEQEITNNIAVIEADKLYLPSPGAACGWCDVTHACAVYKTALKLPMDDQVSTLGAVTTDEAATQAAEQIVLLEKAVSAYKKALGQWTALHGAVTVSGKAFGHYDKINRKYDIDELLKVLQSDLEIMVPYIKLDHKKKAPEDVRALIDAVTQEGKSTYFTSKKMKS